MSDNNNNFTILRIYLIKLLVITEKQKRCAIKKIIETVAAVTAFSCFERFLGFVYRIFLSRSIGSEGIGLYQITLSVVGVLITLTASGTPITVSRLMLKHRAEKNAIAESDVISAGILTSLIISVPLVLALYFGRPIFSFIFTDSRCYDILLVVLPGVVLTSVYAVIRGVFWGNKRFFTYSLVELLEEIVMLVAGFILVSRATDVFSGAKGAGQAALISYIFSFLVATIVFVVQGGKLSNPIREFKPLLDSSMPITAMRTSTSVISSLIAIIIPARLIAAGLSHTDALRRFGELSGMTLPLLFIPSTLIGSIALVLVPELSENFYKKARGRLIGNLNKAIKYSVLISCLIMPVFISCGEEIGFVIYSNINAGVYLSVSAVMMLPMSIVMITTSMLNSLNKEKRTLLNFVLGAIILMLSVWFLPRYTGIYSLIIGYVLSYIISGVLNLRLLHKSVGGLQYGKYSILCCVSSALSTVLGFGIKNILSKSISGIWLVLIMSATVLIFNALMMLIFGVINFKVLFEKKE